tara:strand:+ start:301 stop:549 length:249 start_codon:yes stop_codon:yes gene_type:complete
MSYRKQASLTTLNLEDLLFFFPFNKYFGDIAKAAFKEICSLDDLSIMSLKHIQLLRINIPGQEVHNPKIRPIKNKNRDFIIN